MRSGQILATFSFQTNVHTAMISCLMAHPCVGHFVQVLHTLSYLKCHDCLTCAFEVINATFKESAFNQCDWSEFYPEAQEAIPLNMPEPKGNSVNISVFVDADHAGNRATCRSFTGILIHVNRAPIIWYSKKQNTVESSTFGSEFVAMRIATEITEGLRYRLRMLGIPIDGSASVFCDNMSVVMNTTRPESTLKKKHNAIAYHRVRKAVAAGIICITKVLAGRNLAEMLTKPLPGARLHELCQIVLY